MSTTPVWVRRRPGAAPEQPIISVLANRKGIRVLRSRKEAERLIRSHGAIIRILPQKVNDAEDPPKSLAYTISWRFPTFCHPGKGAKRCLACLESTDNPSRPHLEWLEVGNPVALEAERVEYYEYAADIMERYYWDYLGDQIQRWIDTQPAPRLHEEQQVSVAAAERHILERALAANAHKLRALMQRATEARGTEPQRLAELSGVDQHTVARWLDDGVPTR